MDPVGNVPFFLAFSSSANAREKRAFARSAILYAGGILVIFMFLGNAILNVFQISMVSFRIAGGIALILIGLEMLLGINFNSNKESAEPEGTLNIMPLATPLIAGPGTISIVIILAKEYGYALCLAGIVSDLLLSYVLFRLAPYIVKVIGKKEMAVFANMMGLILVAIGVELIRQAFL